MGLFSKIKNDRWPRPLVSQPYKGHSRTHTSESSGTEASEFLLTVSASSCSSQDTRKQDFSLKEAASNRHSMPLISASYTQYQDIKNQGPPPGSPQKKSHLANHLPHNLPGRPGLRSHLPSLLLNMSPRRPVNVPEQVFGISQKQNRQSLPVQGYQKPQRKKPEGYATTASYSEEQIPRPQAEYQPNASQDQPKTQHQPKTQPQPKTQAMGQFAPRTTPGLFAETSEASESESESGSESDTDSDRMSERHPYYEQWKQYYAAMATYQSRPDQGNSMYPPGMAPAPAYAMSATSMAPVTPPAQITHNSPYMQYANEMPKARDSGLLRNSRMSTIKSNRSSSVPLVALEYVQKSRAISMNVASPMQETPIEEQIDGNGATPLGALRPEREAAGRSFSEVEPILGPEILGPEILGPDTRGPDTRGPDTAETTPPAPATLEATASKARRLASQDMKPPRLSRLASSRMPLRAFSSVAQSLLSLALDENGDQFSDYAFLYDDSANTTDITLGSDRPESQRTETSETTEDNIVPGQNIIPGQIIPDQAELNALLVVTDLPPPPSISESSLGLNRQESSASTSSYNSLQSEKNFVVGRKPTRVATQTTALRKLSRRSKKFVPPMPGPPPPIFASTAPIFASTPQLSEVSFEMHNRSQSTDSVPLEAVPYIQQMQLQVQQQIQQLQQMQQQMRPIYSNLSPVSSGSPPPGQPRSSDSTINAKIDEFILLRRVIAQGNKTYEYRLQWMKMLMTATNYKLYSYINIKGESISSDQAAGNRQSFVKSSVTHLQKILKELDRSNQPQNRKIFAEACYIYGCLLRNDYVAKYEQDFGIAPNDADAEHYFRKCLELNPEFFQAHFKLGELFEQEQSEDKFDEAFTHYMNAAKMGYNRAIYQVAVIYLMVPKVRLTRFFKYFVNLSDIDMESKDIQLGGDDRDELEEVVGLASYQLGKIYEGIYPGDLTPDDEFVQASLEFAPVNYAKSLTYYNRGAKLHCMQAQVKLGHIYESGDLNRNRNANKSILWFIKASTSPLKFKRHPEAMLGISRWFMCGSNGTSKHIPQPDPHRALMWCERACKEFSFPEAFYVMGQLAEQDIAQGDPHEWYAEAERLGYVV